MDNDCPVCFEQMVNGNDNCAMNGINCDHKMCIPCYCKISSSENKKCPICRAELTDDSDDESIFSNDINLWNGDNSRPTSDLFLGRRWFNAETNKLEFFYCFINENEWLDVEKKYFSIFIQRCLNGDNIEGACYICGIQKTTEVNEFMKNKFADGFVTGDDDNWDDYFIEGYNCCYECYNIYTKLNHVFSIN